MDRPDFRATGAANKNVCLGGIMPKRLFGVAQYRDCSKPQFGAPSTPLNLGVNQGIVH
jgi:hypothetical protein